MSSSAASPSPSARRHSATCPPFDSDGDGAVAISELIAAVNRALAGC